jgi:hypothetical protein
VLGLLVHKPEGHLSYHTVTTSFCLGMVYLGRDIKKRGDVAVKLEIAMEWGSMLKHECNVYQVILGICRIPRMLWKGVERQYNAMVLGHLRQTFEEMAQLSVLNANNIFTYAKQMVFSLCA